MADRRGGLRAILVVTVVLSACSLLYELLVAQTLSLAAGNTVVWYSLTVGFYLGALGIGAVLVNTAALGGGWRALFVVEILLSVVGAVTVLGIRLAHGTYLYMDASGVAGGPFVLFGTSLVLITLVGLLSGIELPLLIRLGNEVADGRPVTNRVLAWDYIGALLAGLAFPLALVPYFDLVVVGFATALVNLAAGAWVLLRFAPRRGALRGSVASVALVATALVFGIYRGEAIQDYFLERYYYYRTAAQRGAPFAPLDGMPDVQRFRSPYQKIDLVLESPEDDVFSLAPAYSDPPVDGPAVPPGWYLFLNGDFQLSSRYEEIYHEWFAHVPIVLQGAPPERVLVLGGGDGMLIRELLKYDGVRRIDHIDLDQVFVESAKTDPILLGMNQGSFEAPRVHTRYADGFQFVRRATESWDAIYMDFPFPMDYNLSKLYSREFYHFVKERLAEGGYAVFDAPGRNFNATPGPEGYLQYSPRDDIYTYYHTVRAAGFESVVPFHTRLELENPRAYELLESWDGTPSMEDISPAGLRDAMRREWMRQYIDRHAASLEQSFVLMWEDDRDATVHEWVELGVPLRVLSERRFALAFPPPFDPDTQIDRFRVNSILRPTIPDRRFWSVRSPW